MRELQADKFAKGEGNFQLAAMMALKKCGIKCDDATKVQSFLESHQMGALIIAYKAWTDDQVKQLRKLCELGHSNANIADRIGITIDIVKSKIKEQGIMVFSRGSFELVTKC